MSLYKKLYKLQLKEKKLFFEALLMLYLAKFILIILPFRVCLKTIQNKNSDRKPEMNELKLLKEAIRRANKLSVWNNVCLVQSFAASWMLRRRQINSKLSIGIRHNHQKKLTAHAWLTVDDYEIVPQNGDYVTIISR
jgi:hypothetical protein